MSDDDTVFAAAEESAVQESEATDTETDPWGGVGDQKDNKETDPSQDNSHSTENGKPSAMQSDATDTADNSSSSERETQSLSRGPESPPADLSPEDIPHLYRRSSPKDDRKAVNFYLPDEDVELLDHLYALAKAEYPDETVSKIDVHRAAFRSDLSEESFLAEMERIGYNYWE